MIAPRTERPPTHEPQRWSTAFPYPDEASLLAALTAFYASSHYEDLLTNYTGYGAYTGFVADTAGTGIRALFHAFNSTLPLGVPISPSSIARYDR